MLGTVPTVLTTGTTTETAPTANLLLNNDPLNSATGLSSAFTSDDTQVLDYAHHGDHQADGLLGANGRQIPAAPGRRDRGLYLPWASSAASHSAPCGKPTISKDMNSPKRYQSGFTVAEMIVAAAVAVIILSIGIMSYSASTLRMVARNVATNHSHETARGALERHAGRGPLSSASRFQLINFDGTTYTDVTATVTSDLDLYSQQYVSNRANGVRFLRLGGGPRSS